MTQPIYENWSFKWYYDMIIFIKLLGFISGVDQQKIAEQEMQYIYISIQVKTRRAE